MKKFIATLFLFLLASPVFATTYYVRIDGSDGNPGTTWFTAWRSIYKANTAARPGDKIYVYETGSNYYTDAIAPDSAGSNPTGGGYITFIGASLDGDCLTDSTLRSRVKIRTYGAAPSYTTVKGIHFLSDFGWAEHATRDSTISCIFEGSIYSEYGCYNTVIRCVFLGRDRISMGHLDCSPSGGIQPSSRMVSNFFSDNHFWNIGKNWQNQEINLFELGSSCVRDSTPNDPNDTNRLIYCTGHVDSLKWYNNLVNITCPATTDHSKYLSPMKFFNTTNTFFRASKIIIWLNENDRRDQFGSCPTSLAILTVRDSTSNLNWDADTLLVNGPENSCQDILLSSGNYHQTVTGVTFDSTLIQGYNISTNMADSVKAWNFSYTTIVSKNGHISWGGPVMTASGFNHCTILGDPKLGVLDMFEGSKTWANGPKNLFTFTNNIVYQWSALQQFASCKPSNLGTYQCDWGMQWGDIGRYVGSKHITTNNNLVYVPSYTSAVGDRATGWYNGSYFCSAVGAGSTEDGKTDFIGGDSLSVYGNPQFLQSIPVNGVNLNTTLYNVTLDQTSPAIGIGTSGSDAGAISSAPLAKLDVISSIPTMNCVVCVDSVALIYIHNAGTATLHLTNWVLTASADASANPGTYTADSTSMTIPADSTHIQRIRCTESPANNATVSILFSTDDPQHLTSTLAVLVNRQSGGGNGYHPQTDF